MTKPLIQVTVKWNAHKARNPLLLKQLLKEEIKKIDTMLSEAWTNGEVDNFLQEAIDVVTDAPDILNVVKEPSR